jgi:LCP family protein required for cell wall assembly
MGKREQTSPNARKSTSETDAPRHLQPKRRMRWWIKGIVALTVVVLLGCAVLAAGYLKLQNNIQQSELYQPGETPTGPPQDDDKNPIDILIMGTDTRDGADSDFGTAAESTGEGNADVMMALHISGDRQRATVVSIPRDTIAPFPGCVDAAGREPHPALDAQILNASLSLGGPSCTRKTIEAATGLTFEHFMVADFHAVIDMTNAVGGVPVCVDQAVDDHDSRLKLPAGESVIQGEDALAFLRTRHAFGDASDLSRITAQQSFLSALVRKIKGENTLTNLPKLYSIADTVTKNVTLDKSLASIPAMLKMATRLQSIKPENVTFVTVPHEPWVEDSNRVQLQAEPAARLFKAINDDVDITKTVASPSAAPTNPETTPEAVETPAAGTTEPAQDPADTAGEPDAGEQSPAATPPADSFEGQNANQSSCQVTSESRVG